MFNGLVGNNTIILEQRCFQVLGVYYAKLILPRGLLSGKNFQINLFLLEYRFN